MATEYKTIRVTPEVHALAVQLAEKVRLRSVKHLPEIAQNSTNVALGKLVETGLRLLEKEIEK